MPETYFTADTHFHHAGIISMCGRPFSCVEEMDEEMIRRWNDTVRRSDDVYHLGDFAHKGTAEQVARTFSRLRGRIHLLIGNHDRRKVLDLPWASPPQERLRVRTRISPMPIVCSHYAQRTWDKSHHGAIHLYGHSHGTLPPLGRSLDVGVDAGWDFRPVSVDEIAYRIERNLEIEASGRETSISSEGDVPDDEEVTAHARL